MNNKLNKNTTVAIFFCAIVILILFCFVPLANRLSMSFKDYNIANGLTNSPWVGLRNFEMVFNSFHFSRLVSNTITQNLVTILLAVPLAALSIYMLTRIKCYKTRTILSFIMALPALIPSVVIGNWVAFTYGKEIINMDYNLLYGIIHGIRLFSLSVIAAWAMSLGTACSLKNKKGAWKHTAMLVAIMMLVAASRTMTTDMDFASIVSNPIIYEKSDTLSTFMYRMSFMTMQFGQSNATWTFKFIFELVTTIVCGGLTFILLNLVKPPKYSDDEVEKSSTPFIIVSSIIALAALIVSILVIIPKDIAPIEGFEISFTTPIMLLFAFLMTSALSAVLGALFAFPFARKKKSLTIIYLLILIPCIYGSAHFHEFLVYKQLGMVNTLLPLILGSLSAVWMIPFYAIYLYRPGAKELTSSGDYARAVCPVALILAAIQFTMSWGGMIRPLIYLHTPHNAPISSLIRLLAMNGQQSLLLNLLLVIPILVIWIVIGFGCTLKKCDKIKTI